VTFDTFTISAGRIGNRGCAKQGEDKNTKTRSSFTQRRSGTTRLSEIFNLP
jgi:hypothetical protein